MPTALPAALDRLRGRLVPFELRFFEELPSTNATAADLLAAGRLGPPAVVVAARQTAGRGRMGRTWFTGRESLAASFVLPTHLAGPVHRLPILAGLAVREALAELVGEVGLKIKWPNDLQLLGRKLGGLLCERRSGVDIIGIGLNLRHAEDEPPEALGGTVIALAEASGEATPGRWDVLAGVSCQLRRSLLDTPAAEAWRNALEQWPRHDALLDHEVDLDTPAGVVSGRVAGIDVEGRLCLIQEDDQRQAIVSGSVRAIR